MKRSFPRALGALLLASGCASGSVHSPPAPPAFDPGAARAQATSAATTPPTTTAEKPAAPDPVAAGARESAPAPSAADSAPAAAGATQGAPAGAATKTGEPADPPLGWIAGQPLEAEELLLEWGDVSSRELYLVVDKLVAVRLVLAEAGRLGIKLAPEAVDTRFATERDKLEDEVTKSGKKLALDEFIEKELGFEPKRYLERVRRATIRQMLAERAVRAASLAAESAAVRLIVVPSEEQAEKVRAALAEGRDFGDVAREFSVDDSKKDGGLVPFVVQQERSPFARIAFQTPVGQVAGPQPVSDHQFWIKVEERRAPVEGDWSVVESQVEASLARYPVDDAEFVHWKLDMEKRYPIDLGPLWSLIGAAR